MGISHEVPMCFTIGFPLETCKQMELPSLTA